MLANQSLQDAMEAANALYSSCECLVKEQHDRLVTTVARCQCGSVVLVVLVAASVLDGGLVQVDRSARRVQPR